MGRSRPNPNLRAEYSYKTEIGLKRNFAYGIAQFAAFYNQLYDLIVYQEVGQGVRQLQNIGKSLIGGLEFSLQTRWKRWHLTANYVYLYARNQSDDRNSDFLPNRPQHRLSFIWRWDITERFYFSAEGTVAADQYYENPDNLQWEKLNNYAVFNLKAQFAVFSFMDWYIRANNLLDSDYETDYGVPMLGRTLQTGVRLRL